MHQPVDLREIEEPQIECPCCKGHKVAHYPSQGIWKCWICNGKGTVNVSEQKKNPQWWRN